MIETFLQSLADSALGSRIAEDPVLFPWIETCHVLAITVVFGSILIVDLRLIGLASRDYAISGLNRSLVPLTWIAFIIAAITGALLFVSNPVTYFGNTAFRVKMLLLVLAGINMAAFHFMTMRSIAQWDRAPRVPGGARLAGLISIVIWVSIVIFGRWIGFTMTPF